MINEEAPTMSVGSGAVDMAPNRKPKKKKEYESYSPEDCFDHSNGRKIMSFNEFCGDNKKVK